MGITPWTKGQTAPTWTISMTRDNGGVMDLTGVTTGQLSLIIYNANKVQVGTGAGTFTIPSGTPYPAVVTYAVNSSDVATGGTFYVRVKVNFNGTSPDFSDYIRWEIDN